MSEVKTYSQIRKDFYKNLEDVIIPNVKKNEEERKKKLFKAILGSSFFSLIGLLALLAFFIDDSSNSKKNSLEGAVLMFSLAFMHWFNIKKKFEEARKKTKDPGMYIDVDIFAFLNGELTGIIEAIDALEKQIDSIPGKITDKEVRKNIDAQFKAIEQDIKTLEEHLEKHKDEDPEKHQELVEKLNEQKDRLDKLGKKYRKKCPLLVRVVKSAKSFYKKHKKAILIAAGLAAFALLANTVIIPAIMAGNMMIAYTSPALAGVANFMNTILGGLIGAHKTLGNTWVLATGASVSSSIASTSLLKGLALSGIGTAALVTPIVLAIKKLGVKGKLVDAKAKVKGWFGRNKTEENEVEKTRKPKKRDKQSIDKFYTKYLKMVKDYLKSGMTLDEYCIENELSEGDKQMMQSLLDEYEKSNTNTEGRKRGK